ncbi:transmembrane protein, putative (macronuclear) [Tetrahymena thermophila SB210]|uniref:Transmembrane protein, putative n=1 Tax=Tetrahymena thermophila (strain SB210) TaxID=312017 RepID=W7XLE1_TETTS|nr:transmembrane protein, putative [Tetrahymena thermophila SB210]EWS76129.1 transmembrane protein, putative [Tetrahymena thermophila SB210]|eukprot:XP_012651369.1 transmembrane protein, putative [Tetrahymena thermophila SB210]
MLFVFSFQLNMILFYVFILIGLEKFFIKACFFQMLFDFLSFYHPEKRSIFLRGNKKVFQKIGLIQDFKQKREAAVGFGKLIRLKSLQIYLPLYFGFALTLSPYLPVHRLILVTKAHNQLATIYPQIQSSACGNSLTNLASGRYDHLYIQLVIKIYMIIF